MTGKQLKNLRLDKGITKHKLSSKLGINIRTLNRWEHENQNIHRKYYARIQCIFDLDFFEVITRTYRTEEEKEKLRKQRVEIMGRMDRKAEKWSDLPEDDADLIAFRKVVGGVNFKVGDEVRVIEEASGVLFGNTVGNVCKIKRVDNEDGLTYELDNGFLYRADCLEPITDHDYLMDKILERNNKPEKLNTGDPWIDNLPESYFEMYEEEEMLKELTEPLDLIEQHKRICERLNKVYADKNHDYGNSFGETYEKLGAISAVTRISDKTNRLQSLVTKDEQRVDDERLIDTALDLANYAIMFAMELEETE